MGHAWIIKRAGPEWTAFVLALEAFSASTLLLVIED